MSDALPVVVAPIVVAPNVIAVERLRWADAHLTDIILPRGTMRLTRSLASGLTIAPGDPPGTFWGVGDRGPNIKPAHAADIYGCDHLRPLAEIDGAKIMPLAHSGPAMARFRIEGDAVLLDMAVDLTRSDGSAISGRPTPYGPHAEHEPVYDLDGHRLSNDPDGADSEAIAALTDGTFWVAEEYGPSLLRVDRSGRVLLRWVPQGTAELYADSDCPVVAALPALAVARKLNRGFESIAVTDGGDIILANQSPLAHPDRAAHEHSRLIRIWQLDGTSGELRHEWAFRTDKPGSFRRDADAGDVRRDDIKLSEIIWLPGNKLLLLERISASTHFHLVTLDPALALDPEWSDPDTRPTLEQLDGDEWDELPLLEKQLLFSTDDWPAISADLEGMILIAPDQLLLANDSDFGIEGAETVFWRVTFDGAIGG